MASVRLVRKRDFFDERWSASRSVTAMDWSPFVSYLHWILPLVTHHLLPPTSLLPSPFSLPSSPALRTPPSFILLQLHSLQ